MSFTTQAQKIAVNIVSRAAWHIAPNKTMRAISKLFFVPQQGVISDQQELLLAQATPFELKVLDTSIRGWRWGNGPTIILVHGWGSRGIRLSSFIEPLLERGYSVVTYDATGHGASGKGSTNFFEMIESFNQVCSHVGTVEGVITHSMGGGVAMNYDHRLDAGNEMKFVLISPFYDLRTILTSFAVENGLYLRPYEMIIRQIEDIFGKSLDEVSPKYRVREMARQALIVHDEDDMVVALSEAQQLSSAWDGSRLVTTSGLGHRLILRQPEVVSKAIDFLYH